MLQIALLLFGAQFIKGKIPYLLILATLWGCAGILIFIDGLDGKIYYAFGHLVLFESLMTLSVASSGIGYQKEVLMFKGIVLLCCALIALINFKFGNLLLSVVFGFTYFVTGIFSIASAWVVRFRHWQKATIWGAIQISFSFFLLVHSDYVISYFLGFIMVSSSIRSIKTIIKARSLEYDSSTFQLFHSDKPFVTSTVQKNEITDKIEEESNNKHPLTIHIWTPEGSAENAHIPRPIINRYIAAVDINGVISTGHAAVGMGPDFYISLYPAEDIDRSPSEFFRTLKATPDNNVAGRFLPDYQTEADEWCESNRQIIFNNYNHRSLKNFWEKYQQQPIYNLTYQNCSSTTAYALEAALDGVLSKQTTSFLGFLKVMLTPELWIAAQVRQRALMMAWTPGLIMDYSQALSSIVHPVPIPWYKCGPWQMCQIQQNICNAIYRNQNDFASNYYD